MSLNLGDFSVKRGVGGAIVFYVAYLVVIILLGAIAGAVTGLATGDYGLSFNAGVLVAIIICLYLPYQITVKKNLKGEFKYTLITIISGLLAVLGGGLLGLVPAAYLSTLTAKGQEKTSGSSERKPSHVKI